MSPCGPSLGSVSAAGARPGLQNRGCDDVSPNSDKALRNSPPSVSALCQRAESNDPDLSAVNAAWPSLPEAVKAGILNWNRLPEGYKAGIEAMLKAAQTV